MKKLTHDNITERSNTILRQKTDQLIEVDINDHARAILNKYKGEERPLPAMAEQRLNRAIKKRVQAGGHRRTRHPDYDTLGASASRRRYRSMRS